VTPAPLGPAWVAPDRALVTFRDLGDVEAKRAALKDLVRRWMIATSDGR
jgi:hypothetical protein